MPEGAPRLIDRLADVIDAYDVVLCDVWGVIHNGREAFPMACDALTAAGRVAPVVLISNSPRPSADVVGQLDELGVPRAAWSGFVTSGDATRAALAARAPGPVWRIGPSRDDVLYEGLGLTFSGPEAAAFICCTGLLDDECETPDDYRAALAAPAARGLEMICANPDRVVQRGDRLIWCAGALADLHAALGGRILIAGKPAGPIYQLALDAAARLLGREADRARVLCVGDGLRTDVAGANAQGLDLLYVAAGVDAREAIDGGRLDAARLAAFLGVTDAHARYAMATLA